jgi:hypothetical protein
VIALFQATTQALAESTDLPARQRLVAAILAGVMLLAVIELVRQRKLREEYSVLWVVTALGLLFLAINYGFLIWLTHLIGGVLPTSTLFFGGILFLMLLSLQFSVRLTRNTTRMRQLARKCALLEQRLEELEQTQSQDDEQG